MMNTLERIMSQLPIGAELVINDSYCKDHVFLTIQDKNIPFAVSYHISIGCSDNEFVEDATDLILSFNRHVPLDYKPKPVMS